MVSMAKRKKYHNIQEYLDANGWGAQTRLAEAMGVHRSYITKIASGAERPGFVLAARLAEHCRIPIESFLVAA